MTTDRTDSMTSRTQGWDALTTPTPGHVHREPSTMALATRSLSAAGRLTGNARREALRQHFESFPPVLGSACATRR